MLVASACMATTKSLVPEAAGSAGASVLVSVGALAAGSLVLLAGALGVLPPLPPLAARPWTLTLGS